MAYYCFSLANPSVPSSFLQTDTCTRDRMYTDTMYTTRVGRHRVTRVKRDDPIFEQVQGRRSLLSSLLLREMSCRARYYYRKLLLPLIFTSTYSRVFPIAEYALQYTACSFVPPTIPSPGLILYVCAIIGPDLVSRFVMLLRLLRPERGGCPSAYVRA